MLETVLIISTPKTGKVEFVMYYVNTNTMNKICVCGVWSVDVHTASGIWRCTIILIVSRDDTMLMKHIWTFELKYYKYFSLYILNWVKAGRAAGRRTTEENWKATRTMSEGDIGYSFTDKWHRWWAKLNEIREFSELESIFPSLGVAITDVRDCVAQIASHLCTRNALASAQTHTPVHVKQMTFVAAKSKLLFHRILIAWIQTYPR